MFDRTRGLCAPFLLTAFVLFYAGTAAIADDENNVWHISNAFGNVWVTVGGVQQASLSHERALKPGDSIRTGQNGRALLVRGEEYILISPNSAIEIPKETKQGLLTTIIQRAGSIVLEVEKRNVKHFEVETPLLAALVKGTRFRVTVEKNNSYVEVLRGQVEVSDFRSGQYALIQPGQTAKVSAQLSGLSLSGSGALSAIQQGMPRRSLADPTGETNAQERRAAADGIQNDRQIGKALLHRDVESLPDSLRENAAGQNTNLSRSVIPVQSSPVQVTKTKYDRSVPESSVSEQNVRVVSLLNEGDPRNANVSGVGLRQGDDSTSDSSKPNDDLVRIVLIVSIAFTFSSIVGALRRRKQR